MISYCCYKTPWPRQLTEKNVIVENITFGATVPDVGVQVGRIEIVDTGGKINIWEMKQESVVIKGNLRPAHIGSPPLMGLYHLVLPKSFKQVEPNIQGYESVGLFSFNIRAIQQMWETVKACCYKQCNSGRSVYI